MTTVAYNHKDKQIAVDGRLTANSAIVCDDYKKFIIDGERIFFFCGRVADYSRLISADNGSVEHDADVAAIMVYAGEAYHCNINTDGKFESFKLTFSAAIGRGDEVALTAMDYGASAKEAVKHAGKRTATTGGKIRVYCLKKMEFIK